MSGLSNAQQEQLKSTFGARVNFDPVERKLYSHDIGALPSLVKPIAGGTLADAIVQPASEAEVVSLVTWANANNVALTPRGKASSGYGGAVPRKRGVVVDFYRMKQIVAVDKAAQSAHCAARYRLGGSGLRAQEAGVDAAPVPVQLPGLHRRGLAGARRRRFRLVPIRLLPRQRGERQGCVAHGGNAGVQWRRPRPGE